MKTKENNSLPVLQGYYEKTLYPWHKRNVLLATISNAIIKIWYDVAMRKQEILITVQNANMRKKFYHGNFRYIKTEAPAPHRKQTWAVSLSYYFPHSFLASTSFRFSQYFISFNSVQPWSYWTPLQSRENDPTYRVSQLLNCLICTLVEKISSMTEARRYTA